MENFVNSLARVNLSNPPRNNTPISTSPSSQTPTATNQNSTTLPPPTTSTIITTTTTISSNSFDSSIGFTIIDVISKLKASHWFTVPLDTEMPLYTKRIISPIDFPTIKDNLQKRKYQIPEKFATDTRRVFANSLVYNFDVLNPALEALEIRNDAKTCLFKFEQEWAKYYERNVSPVSILSFFLLNISPIPSSLNME